MIWKIRIVPEVPSHRGFQKLTVLPSSKYEIAASSLLSQSYKAVRISSSVLQITSLICKFQCHDMTRSVIISIANRLVLLTLFTFSCNSRGCVSPLSIKDASLI